MSVATALARARLRLTSTISRTWARDAAAMAIAEPTAPTPMMPNFMIFPSGPSMSRGVSMGNKDLLALRDRDFDIEVGQPFAAGSLVGRDGEAFVAGEETRCASAARRHGDVAVAQLLLEHRDGRPGITFLALGDRDGGVVGDRQAAPRVATHRVRLDERLAMGRIAHRRLGVAARGDAQASDQRGDRGRKK